MCCGVVNARRGTHQFKWVAWLHLRLTGNFQLPFLCPVRVYHFPEKKQIFESYFSYRVSVTLYRGMNMISPLFSFVDHSNNLPNITGPVIFYLLLHPQLASRFAIRPASRSKSDSDAGESVGSCAQRWLNPSFTNHLTATMSHLCWFSLRKYMQGDKTTILYYHFLRQSY